MCKFIEKNNKIKEILLCQLYLWWGKEIPKNIFELFLEIYNTKLKKNTKIKNIIEITKELFSKNLNQSKELSQMIDKYLIPQELEKKQNAEISTPYKLRQEMLDKMPKEFWSKNQKVFEPCCGKGGFLLNIIDRFMDGLKGKIKDKKERYKFIVEKYLYFSDINPTNIFVCKLLLDPLNKYKLNYNEGDTLKLNIKDKWNLEGFDAVIGNPPYQKENKKTTKARGGINNNLYIDFIQKSLKILNLGGYLLFINPQGWRKINSKILKIILNKYTLLNLNLNMGHEYFRNVSVKTDYYVIQNSQNINKIYIECFYKNNKIFSSINSIQKNLKFIPNLFCHEINSILNKIYLYGIKYECIINSDCHKTRKHVNNKKTNKYIYPLFNTTGNPFTYFSSRPHKHQYKKKVLMSNSGNLSPFYDNGKYGTTQDSMYFLVKNSNEGKKMVKILNSKLYTFLLNICKWSNFRNDANLLSCLKYPIQLDIITNKNIFKFFKLNNNECEFIEKYS